MSENTNDQKPLLSDIEVVRRIFTHIDNATTDLGKQSWQEPTDNYRSKERLESELKILQSRSIVFCPSSAIAKKGDYIARDVARVPLIVVRGLDGVARAFRNACRHRGVQLADGHGCTRALVCPYHGWAYSLDGGLRNIPHEQGFPDVDKATRGLAEVACFESNGLVFTNQNPLADIEQDIACIPNLIPDNTRLLNSSSQIVNANWKLYLESSLEGYHIRQTHKSTFFPVQYDNLTVVEAFGENSRVAFPYQSIEGLRGKDQVDVSVDGRLTYVYHLFPNVVISTFPGCMQVNVLEPIDESTTRQHTYLVSEICESETALLDTVTEGQNFAAEGAIEDLEIVLSAQQGLASKANEYLEFGLFESAIVRLHTHLAKEFERVSKAKEQM
ncbi:Rieske 2Fe-2S domain-containing protein [Paraglaciecola agarilytica]|uniref:aromatic ring-hydroxylating oxygenase subunit alpha n=1 Tax=Paraglaciecola chathamensis TaxID=368405 RepID=UPI001C08F139|nr:SRPBCC family protein [Paraglaciecola agarilytica]MBU3017497.1 Rieske 2Fe-2S domain-containing protein [Paraglaciecola agarilytica]